MGRRILSVLAVGILIPACKINSAFVPGPLTVITTQLRGSQVVPAAPTPVSTTNATLTLSANGKSIDYLVNYTGSGTITSVEIRLGDAGVNGPLLFTLTSAPFANPLAGTLTSSDLILATAQGIFNIDDAVNAIVAGKTYMLIRTFVDPAGEMRGQLGAATLASAVLNGAQEVPGPVAGSGTGTLLVEFDATQAAIKVTLTFSGLGSSADAAHIHFGKAGTGAGPIIFDLATVPFTSPLVVTLTDADFQTDPAVFEYVDAIDAFLTGLFYVNVHTSGVPTGEIRGQIGPARLEATLTDGDVFPPVVNASTGSAQVIVNAMQTEFLVLLTHDVVSPLSVGLFTEDPLANGPLLFDVDAIAGSGASPLTATLKGIHLIPSPPRAILTITDVVNAILTKKTYLDVRSASFPSGEIRGQIIPPP